MKSTFILLIVLLLAFQSTRSQASINIERKNIASSDTAEVKSFEPIYFILGTLSDYMGRFQYIEREKQVDRYYPYEKPLVYYLTDYIKAELNLVVDTVFEKSKNSEMFSEELSKTLNSFYGKNDKLINSKFETTKQIYSFLTGVYYRYGERLDTSIYKIQIANSPKHQNCYELLKRIGCKKIFFKYLRNIPAQYILYFEPTEKLKDYLDIIESERIILKKSFDDQITEMMTNDGLKKEFEEVKKELYKSKEKEVKKIINAFEN